MQTYFCNLVTAHEVWVSGPTVEKVTAHGWRGQTSAAVLVVVLALSTDIGDDNDDDDDDWS